MKRLIFIIATSLLAIGVHAQEHYEKWIDVGLFGLDTHYNEVAYSISFTNGYRFNPFIFLGGGIGTYIYSDYSVLLGNEYGADQIETTDGHVSSNTHYGVPIYATIKANFLKTKVSPFFQANLGYVIGAKGLIVTSGYIISPQIGIDINFMQYAIILKLSLDIQGPGNLLWRGEQYARYRPTINIGFKF